jgi:transposase
LSHQADQSHPRHREVDGRAFADLFDVVFHKRVRQDLPDELKPALTPVLDTIAALSLKIQRLDTRIEQLASKRYPETGLLRQVSGVGSLTALSYVLTLEDPQRFKSSRAIGPYLGLRPRQSQSGDLDPELRITKAGDSDLRRLLVGSAHYILGPFLAYQSSQRWRAGAGVRGREGRRVSFCSPSLRILRSRR